MTTKLTGHEAIKYAETHHRTLNKYADPTEEARESLSPSEAREIAQVDPSLIWLEETATYDLIIEHEGHWKTVTASSAEEALDLAEKTVWKGFDFGECDPTNHAIEIYARNEANPDDQGQRTIVHAG